MKSVDNIMTLWNLMDDTEKRELCLRIADRAMADGIADKESVATALRARKKRRPYRKKRSFWMRSVLSINEAEAGMYRLVGDWVHDVAKETTEGTCLTLGWEADGTKYYLLAIAETGGEVQVNGETVLDAREVWRGTDYTSIEPQLGGYL